MHDEAIIFDRSLVRRRRQRAAPGLNRADFLLRRSAEDLVDRLGAITRTFPLAVELGAHSGQFARALGHHAAPPAIGHLVQCDLSAAMIARAPASDSRSRLVADEEYLPFRTGSLDLVVSVLSLHTVNDLPGVLVQIRRALKPDGLFIGTLFGGDTLCELRQALATAEIECEGGLSPRVAPFADLQTLGGLLQRADLALPVVDTDRLTVSYDHPLKLMADLRAMGEANALRERRKTPLRRETLRRACDIYQQQHAGADGRVSATFEIITLTGWAPHDSQQKPLPPGSAKTRLADALGTREHSAGDKAAPRQQPPLKSERS